MVFLQEGKFLHKAAGKLLDKFRAFISKRSLACLLGRFRALRLSFIFFRGTSFLCCMDTGGGSENWKVFLVKLKLWCTVPGIAGGSKGRFRCGNSHRFHGFELGGQSFSILGHRFRLGLVEATDFMTLHSDRIQKALISELFKELIQEFLRFVDNRLLRQEKKPTLCSSELCWLDAAKDSASFRVAQFVNHLNEGGRFSMAFNFNFESADTKDRDCDRVLVEFVLLFHCSTEHFRHHDSFLNVWDKLNGCADGVV